MFHTAKENNIEAEWVPRPLNEKADYLGKIVDFDHWTAEDYYSHDATSSWGPCSLDCVASYKKHKIPRFYSKLFDPDSLGVNLLAFSWVRLTFRPVPPVSLVKNVVRHVCYCQCRGNLVIPLWPLAPFLLERRGEGGFRSFFYWFSPWLRCLSPWGK